MITKLGCLSRQNFQRSFICIIWSKNLIPVCRLIHSNIIIKIGILRRQIQREKIISFCWISRLVWFQNLKWIFLKIFENWWIFWCDNINKSHCWSRARSLSLSKIAILEKTIENESRWNTHICKLSKKIYFRYWSAIKAWAGSDRPIR